MTQPLAYIHPDAKVAQNVIIEPFAFIDKDVTIDEGTWIGPNAVISEGARIGKNCKIFPGANISCMPQDLKYRGEKTETFIGDGTVVREFVTVSRGTSDRYKTVIGKNCLVMAYVHVAHDCSVGDNVILGNTTQLAGHVVVGNWAIVSGFSAVHQFVKIGTHAFIAGGSLVRKDVPPYIKAAREPLSYAGINSVGLARRGFESQKINELQDTYRRIFLGGENMSDALDRVEIEVPSSEERDEVLAFIRNSSRGIIKSPSFGGTEE